MNKDRCQICDGPIVNGRCKLCGMPYRNDEVLYHLNERRSDHYRHATPEARRELEESEIPLGDKAKKLWSVGMEVGKMMSTGKTTSTKRPTPPSREASTNTIPNARHYTRPSMSPDKGQKKRNITAIIITIVIIICALLPTAINFVKENFAYELSSVFGNIDLDDYTIYGFLTKQEGEVQAGKWIPAGRYIAVIEEGYCSIEVQSGDNLDTIYLSDDERQHPLKLRQGDTLSLHNVDIEERAVKLYLIKEYNN